MKKAQQRIDRILESVRTRIQDEVGGLIGATFLLSDLQLRLAAKEEVFEELPGKQVLARMEVTGDVQGHGCLMLEVKDAIRLGGTLIMLPDSSLDEAVSAGQYDEEIADSYGEIANIIAGSYTKVFEEMYPEGCRFIRKAQEVIVPVKVKVDSDEPVPNQLYYRVIAGMTLNGLPMGDLVMLLPAAPFGLEADAPAAQMAPPEQQKPTVTTKRQEDDPEEQSAPPVMTGQGGQPVGKGPEPDVTKTQDQAASAGSTADVAGQALERETVVGFDLTRHHQRVDTLLEQCRRKIGEEMGALLGLEVVLSDMVCRLVGKEEFFLEEAAGKQILARMEVTGEIEGNGYLFIGLKDAIHIGGTLIMLPPAELEKAVMDEEFGEDAEDAYGEMANIIAGVYSAVFEEQYIKKLRFVKTGIEKILPLKVDVESDAPFPDQFYYLTSSALTVGGKVLGKLQTLFPVEILQLEGLLHHQEAPPFRPQPTEVDAPGAVAVENAGVQGTDVLIVSEDSEETAKIVEYLKQRDLSVKVLSPKENVVEHLPGTVKAVFLVIGDVNEKAFALAIKISSACSLPLIAAAPGWTRSKVITAVKYGVDDILLTPATSDDIAEKVDAVSIRLAA